MSIFGLDVLSVSLDVFSMNERVFYILIILTVIFMSYMVIKPLTSILLSMKSYKVINFTISSLVVLLVFLIYVLFMGNIDYKTYELFKFVLLSLSGFSIILAVMQMIYLIKRKLNI